jgi:hypothetical protein
VTFIFSGSIDQMVVLTAKDLVDERTVYINGKRAATVASELRRWELGTYTKDWERFTGTLRRGEAQEKTIVGGGSPFKVRWGGYQRTTSHLV